MTTKSRVALVTGASRGIGREIAWRLAALGMKVVAGVRKSADGDRLVRELAAHGVTVETVLLDVAEESPAAEAAGHVIARHGRLDVLVNNAGVMIDPKGSKLLDSSMDT